MTAQVSIHSQVDGLVVTFIRDTQTDAEAAADSWVETGSPDPDQSRDYQPGDEDLVDRTLHEFLA